MPKLKLDTDKKKMLLGWMRDGEVDRNDVESLLTETPR